VRAALGMLLCFAVEYSTGALLVAAVGLCPWDYSASWASVHGLIRLDYAPYWFMCAFMCEVLFTLVGRVHLWAPVAPAVAVPPVPLEAPASLYAGVGPG
jgi:uncharacterized membrane protein